LPNALTCLRLLLVPVFAGVFLAGRREAALAVFVAASVTDGLDGLAARILDQRTRLGAWLDPLADKWLVLTALLLLVREGTLPGWLLAAVALRDVGIAAAVAGLRVSGRPLEVEPVRLGKYATFLVLALVATGLARPGRPGAWAAAGLVLAAECIAVSAVQYFLGWVRTMRRPPRPSSMGGARGAGPARARRRRRRPSAGARTCGAPTWRGPCSRR
jgi:cardiolipin synthase